MEQIWPLLTEALTATKTFETCLKCLISMIKFNSRLTLVKKNKLKQPFLFCWAEGGGVTSDKLILIKQKIMFFSLMLKISGVDRFITHCQLVVLVHVAINSAVKNYNESELITNQILKQIKILKKNTMADKYRLYIKIQYFIIQA